MPLVGAVSFVVLAVLEAFDGTLGGAAWRAAFAVVCALQAWSTLATRTSVDADGLHVRMPPSKALDLAWDEVADILVQREPREPPRILVETTAGAQHRPFYVPVDDVEELRAWWRVHRTHALEW